VLPLGLTYSAHPVSCAAALETLKIYEDEQLIENTIEMSKYVTQRAEEMKQKHPSIGNFRTTGIIGLL
jgi:taurine--2-oxoglutarate transaminase